MAELIRGFKNFLLRGDVIVIAIGLIVATALSVLVKSFTDNIIKPIINRIGGSHSVGLGFHLGGKGDQSTFVNIGALLSDVIYFVIFMGAVYFILVVPYKQISARRGVVVFSEPAPAKTCPECLSEDLPVAARKCRYCGSDQPVSAA